VTHATPPQSIGLRNLTRLRQARVDALLTPLLPTAYRAAISLTRNQADAEDIVQEQCCVR